jgi:hypothetical protein
MLTQVLRCLTKHLRVGMLAKWEKRELPTELFCIHRSCLVWQSSAHLSSHSVPDLSGFFSRAHFLLGVHRSCTTGGIRRCSPSRGRGIQRVTGGVWCEHWSSHRTIIPESTKIEYMGYNTYRRYLVCTGCAQRTSDKGNN